jgi:hypothetical protein
MYLVNNTNTSVAKFLHDVTNAVAGTNARLLVVSRDEPEIRRALINDARESFVEYRIMPEDVRSDTAAYSQSIVDRKLPNKNDDIRSTLSEAMTNRCQGISATLHSLRLLLQPMSEIMGFRHISDVCSVS